MTTPGKAAAAEWPVWSTTVRLIVTDPDALADAKVRVLGLIGDIDKAASRFRPDSEVRNVHDAQGHPVRVSPLLAELVRIALAAAAHTDGDLDPTVGAWLCELGYDRNLDDIPTHGAQPQLSMHLAPDWRQVRLAVDGNGHALTTPDGVLLDLGATAKAYAADRCAAAVAELGCGALVSVGGDIATAGPAPHGVAPHGVAPHGVAPGGAEQVGYWRVRVQDGPGEPGTTVTLPAGAAIATSSIVHRRWRRGDHVLHHILDPGTGLPASSLWRTATVAADTCVRANTASTVALIRGERGPAYLADTGLAARLVAADGSVLILNGWPADRPTAHGRATQLVAA